MFDERNKKCEYCGYPTETGEHHLLCYINFENKPDNSDEYFAVDTSKEDFFQNNLTNLTSDEIPSEDIDVKDTEAFKRFSFAKDTDGNIWLYRKIEAKGITMKFSQKREVVSRLAKELGAPVVECKTLTVDGEEVFATRFLQNAIDGRLQYAPNSINITQAKDLSVLWVFNYFICNKGDLQVLSTSRGRAILADFGISGHIPDDIDVEREKIDEYRNFIGGVENRINEDVIKGFVAKIKTLPDIFFESIVKVIDDEKTREQILESLKWRRDNIEKIFRLMK